MNVDLLDLINQTGITTPLLERKGNFQLDDTIGVALLFAAAFRKKKDTYFIIANNLYNAQKISDLLASLLGDDNVLLYPCDDLLRTELVTSSKEMLAQRLYVMSESFKNEPKIVVGHIASVITPLPLKEEFKKNMIHVKRGEIIDLNLLKSILVQAGYLLVNKIDQSLEFASRGDILDIFSINNEKPIRIELFDDEIESIHEFDIASQTSGKELEEAYFAPANDCLISDHELLDFKTKVDIQLAKDKTLLGDDTGTLLEQNVMLDYDNISSRVYHPKTYKYYRFIKDSVSNIIDYFNPKIVFITNDEQFESNYNFLLNESRQYLNQLFEDGRILSHQELYLHKEDVFLHHKVIKGKTFKGTSDDYVFETRPLIFSKSTVSNLKIIIESYLVSNEKVILTLSNKQQLDTVMTLLKEENISYERVENLSIPDGKLGISLFGLSQGFELPMLKCSFISSRELFGYRNNAGRFISRYKEGTILKDYEELEPGDYVVHEQYGIGKFLEIKTIEIEGVHTDFLHIQYAGENALYIPLTQFRMVRKYSGKEGYAPKLSNPNNGEWEKTKTKIKERINLLADRLFKLYSERAQIKGYAFQKDDELQEQFEKEFPYELTEGQSLAVKEIKEDMEKDSPMDRLLCGDVGFGKTEVAFRAVFKAISSGKQVAILCPTTILAKQHYDLAVERFSSYGIRIAQISRLVPASLQKQYAKEIAEGKIDLVIGTHRLLSKDFSFKDLGLLVIDEEQRFGVAQKEAIKELKTNIDVLSLSATPIPRTLQLSLIGVRPVSTIQTPPENRTNIQTYVTVYKKEIVKELIERELSRQGQVFYVHNVVYNITSTAESIHRMVPSARLGIIHGQMDKAEIEDVMFKFYNGEIDVLVATSIIENGIDIPNANLIIVEDADKFGLAQLYQIKGRVGRGGRLAYAYLFYKENKTLNKAAEQRLKAIQDFVELGSGYKIAQRDLMIRGAGDILGPEQAGFIDSVGLDLYLKMLNEATEERKTGHKVEPPKPMKVFKIDAYIPADYASKEDKIELYQEIDACKTEADLKTVSKKIRDIYGRLPQEVNLLIRQKKLDILINNEEFDKVNDYSTNIEIVLTKKFSTINGVGNVLFDVLQDYMDIMSVSYLNKTLKIRMQKEDDWMKSFETILNCIHDIYIEYKK